MLASHFLLDKILLQDGYVDVLTGVFDASSLTSVADELALRVVFEYQSDAPIALWVDHIGHEACDALIAPAISPATDVTVNEWRTAAITSDAAVCPVDHPLRWCLQVKRGAGVAAMLRNIVVSLLQVDV